MEIIEKKVLPVNVIWNKLLTAALLKNA